MGGNSAPFIFASVFNGCSLTLLHSERAKLHRVLAVLSAIGLRADPRFEGKQMEKKKLFPLAIMSLKHGDEHMYLKVCKNMHKL